MNVDQLRFKGDYSYVHRQTVCPKGFIWYPYIGRNRFSRSLDERQVQKIDSNSSELVNYKNFLAECNNTTISNYSVGSCWQKFEVDYTVYFNDSEINNNLGLEQRKVYYKTLLLDDLLSYQDGQVLLLKLNDSSNTNKVYIYVDSVTNACKKYFSIPADQKKYDDCLNGLDDSFVLNQTKNDAILGELAQNYTDFGGIIQIYLNFFKND